MIIKWKKLHENAVQPTKSYPGDAGMDFTAVWHEWDNVLKIKTYGTGIAMAIPEGHVGLLFPRSSIYKTDLSLANSVGVLDSGYRGEILFKFREVANQTLDYVNGDRVGQLIIMQIPDFFWDESVELPESTRSVKGHGSSGLINDLKSVE